MNMMIRSIGSTLGKTLVPFAFAFSLLLTSAVAFADQESDGERQRHRHYDELTFTQIDFPGTSNAAVLSINDRGHIAGNFLDAQGVLHSFLLENGVFKQFDHPMGFIATYGINDRGQIVGSFQDTEGVFHGYLLDDGVFTQIDFPGATGSQAGGINKRGQIVGNYGVGQELHRYLLDKGVFTTIDFPGAVPNIFAGGAPPIAINDRGQIVSEFKDTAGAGHGYLLDDGVFTQIDVSGAAFSQAAGINNRGQIVGSFTDGGGVSRGFLLDQDVFTQIDVPGASLTRAQGINDRGQIVGDFGDSAGIFHGFLATKEQFNGNATGVGTGEENAGVEIVGTFTSPTDFDLSVATLTVANLLNEQAGGGELVSGPPLVLTAVPGSRRNVARFVDQSRPNLASVTILDAGPGKFIFRMKVDDATINSPQNCSPTRLTTGFRLDAANNPPIVVSTERSWDCFGPSSKFLKTP
jgi:probable HAF family extracellular repeat protein